MEELQEIHSLGNTIIMVTHNPALTTYATRVINMLDGEIDTDIKTVADQDLPKPGDPEKISVRILSKKRPVELEVDSKTKVVVTGKNVTIEDSSKPEAKEEPKEETDSEEHKIEVKKTSKKPAAKPEKKRSRVGKILDKAKSKSKSKKKEKES